MDEPLASLDVTRRDEVLRYIELLRDDLAHPDRLRDSLGRRDHAPRGSRWCMLSEGSTLAVGPVDEVMGQLDLRPHTGRFEAGAVIDTDGLRARSCVRADHARASRAAS